MNQRIKILFILPSLKAGGAERVISFVAQHLDQSKFHAILLVVGYEKDMAYHVSGIEIRFLNRHRVLNSFRGIFKSIKELKPDIVLTSIAHLTAITVIQSMYFRKIKFVAREANIKKITKVYHQNRIPFGKFLNSLSYTLLDVIICQSIDMADELIELKPKTKSKIVIINNPITVDSTAIPSNTNSQKPTFITVGRLHNEKGHNRILEALSLLNIDFEYIIIGTGPHKASIVEKAYELNLSSKINWIDYSNDIPLYLMQSDIFIQGSYAEGFPNALLESCSVGTPVIAYKAPGGTSEIVEHGINGYLVNDEMELKSRIIEILEQPFLKESIKSSVYKKFGKDIILNKYETLFTELIQNA